MQEAGQWGMLRQIAFLSVYSSAHAGTRMVPSLLLFLWLAKIPFGAHEEKEAKPTEINCMILYAWFRKN